MNQKIVHFFTQPSNQKPLGRKSELAGISLNRSQTTKTYSLSQIRLELNRILARENLINKNDTQTLNTLETLTDVLSFALNYMSSIQVKNPLTSQRQKQYGHNSCLRHAQQISELKASLQNKKQIIVQLNMGYQQAKLLFDEQIAIKQNNLAELKRQICDITAENNILKEKINVLMNYRVQKNKLIESNNTHSPQFQGKTKIIRYLSNGSGLSRKSSNYEIKDLIQAMTTNIHSNSEQRTQKNNGQSRSRLSYSQKLQKGTQQTSKPSSQKKDETSKRSSLYGDDNCSAQEQLMEEVSELRENQSKLLDRICERDEIISGLLMIKCISDATGLKTPRDDKNFNKQPI